MGNRPQTQLRLYQHQPLPLFSLLGDFSKVAFTVVISPDQPSQPTLLGLYDSGSPWTPTVALSSTPARQPTELILPSSVDGWATLVNLSSAQTTYLHGYITGYYWYNHCVCGG